MSAADIDVEALETALRERVTGDVRFGAGERAAYSTDASNYRQVPIGVVIPRSVDDVVATVATCREHDAPVLSRGGGTSLAGQCCNVAVVIDWSNHLHHVLDVDPGARRARVQPGCVLDDLRDAAAPHGLTFGPDPATHTHCTLGGMIGNNSCGVHSVMAGRTADNVHRLEVLTYDGCRMWVGSTSEEEFEALARSAGRVGEIYRRLRALRDRYAPAIRERFPRIPRRVSGFNLDELLPERGCNIARALVGTEGTCVAVLEAEVDLVPRPPFRRLVVLGFEDVVAAGHAVPDVMACDPIGCEGIDHLLFRWTEQEHLHPDALAMLPDGHAWLLVEFGGDDPDEATERAQVLCDRFRAGRARSVKLVEDAQEEARLWLVRESGLGATARDPGDGTPNWPGWEDSAVPPERVGDYLRDLRTLTDRHGYQAALYGHFGQGCIHTRLDFDLEDPVGIARTRDFLEEAADLVVSYGGTLSGEHGDGQARAELLPKMFGEELVEAFAEFSAIWDPDDRMNPGKVIRPARLDQHLRLGPRLRLAAPDTYFAYPRDDHDFATATMRCVGIGNCRREGGGTMCPSYMVTREERHSTRGRARLLFEMMQGDVIRDSWRSEEVRDALDLCLACKGCRHDCPVNVDMATYKAEFLAHHYAGRLRPAAHYTMGWLPLLAQLASRVPNAVNAASQWPPIAALAKRAGGIDPHRSIPRFAPTTLRAWFAARPPGGSGERGDVLLWPDTFTNHFEPRIGRAAVAVLEQAGYRVRLPEPALCCGLTWISTGQLGVAKRVLARTVRALAPAASAGVPIVGLEPSCTAALRSDLVELLAGDRDAARVAKRTRTLAELLASTDGWKAPDLGGRRALVQTHCHHGAVLGTAADDDVLERTGLDAERLDSGCCGLAGNFGFERGHHEVSMACAERVLLPAVRDADERAVVMADGFSCRTQIRDGTGRTACHLAEVLAGALDGEAP